MGTNTDGILAFGFNLGAPEEWELVGVDKWGELSTDWYSDECGEDEDREDFAEAVENKLLLEIAGFIETFDDALASKTESGYFERKRQANRLVRVHVACHCSCEYPMYMLVTREITARRGRQPVDVSDLIATDTTADRAHLAEALRYLGVTPKQPEPTWLLASLLG